MGISGVLGGRLFGWPPERTKDPGRKRRHSGTDSQILPAMRQKVMRTWRENDVKIA